MGKLENSVVSILEDSDEGLTLPEVAERGDNQKRRLSRSCASCFRKA